MDSFSGDQWRDKRDDSCDYRCDYSDGFSNHKLIIVAHEDCAVQGWCNLNFIAAIHQQGLCSRGRVIQRAKIGLDFCSVFSRLLCSSWIVLRACEKLCMSD